MKYIDFDLKDRSLVYYAAIILIVVSHTIHFLKSSTVILMLQITFIIGYILLIVNNIEKNGKIHIATLLYRLIIIIMLLFSVVPKIS
jgi:hypothetical protein